MIDTVIFYGILSAYCFYPTVGTIEYRQNLEQLPQDLSGYEFYIAVDDCGLIGNEATLFAGDLVFNGIVFDCAGADGIEYFSNGNDLTTPYKLAGDVDYWFWQEHPEIVRSLVLIEIEAQANVK